MNIASPHLKEIDPDEKKTGGLIDLTAVRRSWAQQALDEAVNRPIHIVVNPRNGKSKVSKWARIPSFTYDKTYLVVKYRRHGTLLRYGCTCEDFITRKGCNEGRGHTRTCKHIRVFRVKEREMLDNQKRKEDEIQVQN